MKTIFKNISFKYEVLFLIVLNLIFLLIFAKIDLLELLYTYSQAHESYELDEIIPLFITISISLMIFSYRRLNESKELSSKLYYMANHDDLTDIFNRRYINDALMIEFDRSQRTRSVFSLILLDIDDFKKINDNFGHQTGDKVLIKFSQMLQKSIRKIDGLGRWGGEEFLILCRDTDHEGAEVLAQKLIEWMHLFECDLVNSVTASMGVVTIKNESDIEALFKRVDSALYDAKAQGKNQYIVG